MDVALVGSYPPPHGGQAVHIRNLANFLRARRLGVQVLNTGSNKVVREDGIINIASAGTLLRALLFGPRFKVIHVHVSSAEDFGKLVPVAMAAMATGVPWVATIHGGDSADRLRDATLVRRTASRAVLARAKKIICVNSTIREEFSSLLREEALIVIPPFSVDFAATTLPPEMESFLADHTPVISCVGLYEPTYGFERAIEALATIRRFHPKAGLILLGDLKGAEPYRALAAELGLHDHVTFGGNFGHDECLEVMSRSALFLRSTLYDGDALSVREALALGVRVVASATDFRPDGVTLYRSDVPGDCAAKVMSALKSDSPVSQRSASDCSNLEQVRLAYMRVMTR